MDIKRGTKFLHARQITGSPKAGTARPLACVVTQVTKTTVYYRPDDGGTTGTFYIDRGKFDSIVKDVEPLDFGTIDQSGLNKWMDLGLTARLNASTEGE